MKKLILLLCLLTVCWSGYSQTIVERHGQLRVEGKNIKDKCGRVAQLKGMSYFWHQWDGKEYWNADVIKWLRDDWKVEIVRAAMGVRGGDDPDDYINNPTYATGQVKKVVDGAIQHGIYVIIDFHAHPNYKTQAKTFFAEMSRLYGNSPNVIYEIWNEPIGEYSNPGAMWTEIKEYSRDVIATIRANDPDGLIIVPTPFYDQFPNTAADSPLTTDINGASVGNVAYTVHVYADAHTFEGYVGVNARYALDKGLPMFITESGATGTVYNEPRETGINAPDYNEWKKWEDWWDINGISYTKWSMSTKNEFGSSLLPGAPVTGNWNYSTHLTDEGRWNRDHFRAVNTLPAACTTTPVDDIITVTSPATVTRGTNATVTVKYSASTARDVRVMLQTDTSPYTTYADVKVDVVAGSDQTVNITVPIGTSVPVGTDAYQFQVFITTDGGTWTNKIDNIANANVDVVAAATGPVSGSVYRLKSSYGNKYLNSQGNTNTSNVGVADLNTGWSSQQWTLELVSGSVYRLKSSWGNKYLNSQGNTNTSNVNVADLNTGWDSQKWTLELVSGSIYRLKNSWGNKYLNSQGNTNGANVGVADLNTSWSSQQWTLELVSSSARTSAPELESSIVAYPNPISTQDLTIQLNGKVDKASTFSLIDISGRQVLRKSITENAQNFTIRNDVFPADGLYLIRVQMADGVKTHRVIVNR